MAETEEQLAPPGAERKKPIVYFVNGEREESDERELSVQEILSRAGFTPTDEWTLSRDSDGYVFQSQDELVRLHEDERFTATRNGPTPTS
jgi:hypothetical protein